MEPLTYARAQMGMSLAFHILFAAAGVALPVLMTMAEARWQRTRDPELLALAKRLAKGTSIIFAVGAVSGTVLSFELGLLWPQFMAVFGDAIGLPFALEGFAFFTEAIFLGIFLYGRGVVSDRLHLWSGVAVAVSGAASAFFVTLVNAFMNNPAGFLGHAAGGAPLFDPTVALWSPSWPTQTAHVLLSCYEATAFAMVGIHACMLLRTPGSTFHRKALALALPMACVTAVLQPLAGDLAAKHVAAAQPVKLAALEAHFETQRRAPLHIGGWPDLQTGTVRGAVPLPGGLSFLAFSDPQAEVQGLRAFPRDEWPPVTPTRTAFQVMVGCGTVLALVSLLTGWLWWRRRELPTGRRYLWLLVLTSPLGMLALEAGWLVTEWGRQPWVVRGFMRTAEAVTSFPYKAAPFWMFSLVYLFLGVVVIYLLRRQILATGATAVDDAGH